MKHLTVLLLTTVSVFVGQGLSFPLFGSTKNILPKRIPQSPAYSVVAVDGGSSSALATKTVTDAVTQVQTATATATVLSTVISTLTDAQPTTIVVAQTATVSPQASVTSVPYDDGQWHTTYYFRSTVAPQANVAATSTQSPVQSSTTSKPDPGQWAYWSQKNGNGQ